MHFSNPDVGKEAGFKMIYNSISSPPSRYFFAEPSSQSHGSVLHLLCPCSWPAVSAYADCHPDHR
jgi:hypothetical protein